MACMLSVALLRLPQVCRDELFDHIEGCLTRYAVLLLSATVPPEQLGTW